MSTTAPNKFTEGKFTEANSTEARFTGGKLTRVKDAMPWAWCNLDRNPFGEMSPADRARLAVVDDLPPEVQPHSAHQWIAPCGFGKTTRLLAATAAIPGAHYVYVTPERTCPAFPLADCLVIDEADRMPRRLWRRVVATGRPLLLGTHRSLSRRLVRAGYQVQTHSIAQRNRPEHLVQVVLRRLEHCRLDRNQPAPSFSLADAKDWFNRYGGNIRAIEFQLYELVQAQRFGHGRLRLVD